ncbi:hypothetical protein BT96DRAFT_828184, partial [Gymnopus androsaceus JB14]
QPCVLIFFDSNTLTCCAAKFLRLHAPPQFQGTDFAMHYYGSMSPDYLKKAHNTFTLPNGPCQILCAKLGESTGIDFDDVRITVNVGIIDPCGDEQ